VPQVENLYIGTCPLHTFGFTERLVDLVGADRIVFGSDLSWNPVAWGLGPVFYSPIPLAAKRQILGGNMRRLMAIHGARGSPGALRPHAGSTAPGRASCNLDPGAAPHAGHHV
jgi:hypothetical protein